MWEGWSSTDVLRRSIDLSSEQLRGAADGFTSYFIVFKLGIAIRKTLSLLITLGVSHFCVASGRDEFFQRSHIDSIF